MIVLIGLLMSVSAISGEIVRTPMLDFTPTKEMDYIYEIKTTKFDKVMLDCQSFITGMTFTSGESKSNVYIDAYMCEEMISYLQESKDNNLPVCLGLDSEYQELYLTRDEGESCN